MTKILIDGFDEDGEPIIHGQRDRAVTPKLRPLKERQLSADELHKEEARKQRKQKREL